MKKKFDIKINLVQSEKDINPERLSRALNMIISEEDIRNYFTEVPSWRRRTNTLVTPPVKSFDKSNDKKGIYQNSKRVT